MLPYHQVLMKHTAMACSTWLNAIKLYVLS